MPRRIQPNPGLWVTVALVALSLSCMDRSADEVVPGDCPRVVNGDGPSSDCMSAVFYIGGLDRHVVDSEAPQLEARMLVGETISLSVELQGCASTNHSAGWVSTNPVAATLTPKFGGSYFADLTGVGPGRTTVYADLTFRNHEGFRVHPAIFAAESCRAIDGITVVPR